jgi:MoaA/NifB/PqqE/SkfB family radical SAM enzyme
MPTFRALLISGGEPFMRPKLEDILLAFCRNNGVRALYIPTNGWYTDRTADACRSFLEQEARALLTISFSVDGLEATHDRLRGKGGAFANLCKTIERLSPWRDRSPNLRLRVNSVVTAENVAEMSATLKFFHERYRLDEHSLEIVRDSYWKTAVHGSPERKSLADRYVALVDQAYDLYYGNHQPPRRGVFGNIPERLSHLALYAHNRAMAQIKRDRIRGKLWPFRCVAGRTILVVNGSGSLRACEHRDEVVDLAAAGFDFRKAMARGAMAKECASIAADRCDCLHGCFVGNSLQHSPGTILTRVVPVAIKRLFARRGP